MCFVSYCSLFFMFRTSVVGHLSNCHCPSKGACHIDRRFTVPWRLAVGLCSNHSAHLLRTGHHSPLRCHYREAPPSSCATDCAKAGFKCVSVTHLSLSVVGSFSHCLQSLTFFRTGQQTVNNGPGPQFLFPTFFVYFSIFVLYHQTAHSVNPDYWREAKPLVFLDLFKTSIHSNEWFEVS